MVSDYKQRNIFIAFVKLREHLKAAFDHCGIIEMLGKTWYLTIHPKVNANNLRCAQTYMHICVCVAGVVVVGHCKFV